MTHLYRRLAIANLKNNRQFYLPYLLIGMASAMMFYIMRALQDSEDMSAMRGFHVVKLVLLMGLVIIGGCACIFLFYTNSFVMKRRKKEFGVYNILGMEKKHIARVMAWESLILYLLSVGGGLLFGILFHKLVAMFLYQLTGLSESIPFYISGLGCLQTAELFALFYLLILLYNFIQIKLANPIALLHGSNAGEREPKAKWLLSCIGIACILTGYYLALATRNIAEALNMFFVAVILVIIGTYALFLTVSILFFKLLKKNKNYYYKTTHFITVSGMLYRMKRNAVGLANICILSTMVLVMISTTVCMYSGIEDALLHNYPREIDASFYLSDVPSPEIRGELHKQLSDTAKEQNRTISNQTDYASVIFTIHTAGNAVELYDGSNASHNEMGILYVMTKEDYEAYSGTKIEAIAPGNVLLASSEEFIGSVIRLFGIAYPILGNVDFSDNSEASLGNVTVTCVVVADNHELETIRKASASSIDSLPDVCYMVEMDIDGTPEEKKAYASALRENLGNSQSELRFNQALIRSRAAQRDDYLEMNGGLLFLGLFLGSLFLMITVLIIYYKQISEGFEDRERFAILTKVGLSKDTVKAAIHAQVRIVFFMPITVAVIHLIAAFPMLSLMLQVFGLVNTPLFLGCLAATTAIFAVIYFIVFRLTSKSYYNIVYR